MTPSKYIESEEYGNGFVHYYSYNDVRYRTYTTEPFASLSDERKLFLQEQTTITGILRNKKTSAAEAAELLEEVTEYFYAIRCDYERQAG